LPLPYCNVADLTRLHARERPGHVALIFGGRAVTYSDLNRHASMIANGLIEAGVARHDRVALLAGNSDHYIELLFGIIKAGATPCPINWRLAPGEIAYVLRDSSAAVLFYEARFGHVVEQLSRELELRRVIALTEDETDSAGYVAWRDSQVEADPELLIAGEDASFQLYTSGTTGAPKGVLISHNSIIEMRRMEDSVGESWIRWDESDVVLVGMPLFHIAGSFWALQFLYRGSTCVIQPTVNTGEFLAAIRRHGVTRLFVVPSVLKMMLDDGSTQSTHLTSLKTITYGGSPISPELLGEAMTRLKCGFVQIFGMTETAGTIAYMSPEDHDPSRPDLLKSCGRAFSSVEIGVFDENGNALPDGTTGEICVRTPTVMSGYWRRPEALREVMRGDWYRTGDAGFRHADGYYFLVDRVKDMIVSGGENIFPSEVEEQLRQHELVRDVAVIGVPDPKWGEAVKAIIVPASGSRLNHEELVDFLKPRIASYKIPKSIAFVEELPRNASGKVLKRALREIYWASHDRRLA
jgi:acyl-CoA synthetase (AMP-forming)/AMP-acid ligase II